MGKRQSIWVGNDSGGVDKEEGMKNIVLVYVLIVTLLAAYYSLFKQDHIQAIEFLCMTILSIILFEFCIQR